MTQRPTSDAGFTLVEALVSLFVFGLIAAGSVAMLMQSVDSQRRVSLAQGMLRDVQVARALFSGDVAQIVAREVRAIDGTRRPSFIGGDETIALAFTRGAAEPSENGGASTNLAYVEYVIEDDQLLRRSRVFLDATDQTPITERVVLSDVRDVRFEFYDGFNWRGEWVVRNRDQAMPRAVALIATAPRYGEIRINALMEVTP